MSDERMPTAEEAGAGDGMPTEAEAAILEAYERGTQAPEWLGLFGFIGWLNECRVKGWVDLGARLGTITDSGRAALAAYREAHP